MTCQAPISPSPHDPLTHYILVREDLPVGNIAAQIAHAAGESSPGHLPPGTYAIVLALPNERALVKEADRLRRLGIAYHAVFEADPPYEGQLMALGLAPARRSALHRHLSSLPLLKIQREVHHSD